jgi:imidazolonepropionase-like amidohydrolase
MKARGTYRSPTLCAIRGIVDNPSEVPAYAVEKGRGVEAASRESQVRALKAGVLHVCGTDAGTPFNPHGSAPKELAYMVDWGMTPLAAMRAGTANGADLLRLPDVGRVAKGTVADLVLYENNPVDDIAALGTPLRVWRAGTVVSP